MSRPIPVPAVVRVDPASAPDSRRALATMLRRAFDQDTHINWIVRQDGRRSEALARLFDLMLVDLLGRHGEVHATADLRGTAIWYPPGASALGLAAQARVGLRFAAITGWRAWLLKAYGLNRMAMRQPRTAHFFLQTIGVDPDCQGSGHGTALMRAFTERCDLVRVAGYLETGNADNVPFYERHGFHVVASERLPRGPLLWRMLRPAPV